MGKKQSGQIQEQNFEDIVNLITSSKNKAYQAVNTVLAAFYGSCHKPTLSGLNGIYGLPDKAIER